MADDERFDLSYRGLIAPGADPEDTRRRLAAIFKLTEQGLERLFTGKPVIVKRDVDDATAAQFEKIFSNAGAVLTVTPVEGSGPAGDPQPPGTARAASQAPGAQSSELALAPDGGDLEEPPPSVSIELDISYLSLVPGYDWTLEDCQPLPTPIPLPDLSYLSLVPLETEEAPQGWTESWRAE